MQRAHTGIDGQHKRHTDLNFSSIPGAGQAENIHSVLRCSQQKSLSDVTQTQEFTEHTSFTHLDLKMKEDPHGTFSLVEQPP